MQKENPTEFFEIFIAGTKTSKSFFILSTLDSTTNHQDMCSRLVLSVVVACPATRFSSTTGTRTHSAARDENTCARLIHNKRTMTKIKGLDRRLSVSYRGKFHIRHSNLSICWPSRWLTWSKWRTRQRKRRSYEAAQFCQSLQNSLKWVIVNIDMACLLYHALL